MRWIVVAAAVSLVGLLAYGVASTRQDTSIDEAILRGERIDAPAADLPRLGAPGTASVEDFEGRVVVLNFWASWCPPCVEELPLLQRAHERLQGRDALVLGVNYKDLSNKALGFVREFELTFPTVRDRDGEYAERYGTRAFPETFVIDREGRIAARRRGPIDQAWIDAHVTPLLEET